ncbi:hypothetical protein POM88_046902 [Heracleum sosnowskyi]|uniref:RNase H type-1 domain-containing protein n=1 Tax=Heracleum sosnowskyi TaxID=360622 RepID=A0AAD8HA07_9APIA|nr:hypothetical protein POM88_046902 [Heracleum sosnowskyi]
MIYAKSIYHKQNYSAIVAEVSAIREGLYLASKRKFQNFMLESDCVAAISLINVKQDSCTDLDNMISDIKDNLKTCRGLKFVPREANSVKVCAKRSQFSGSLVSKLCLNIQSLC